jgi:hypothetical protein
MASFEIAVHVGIDQTGGNGVRNAASSAWSHVEAPAGHVINKDKVQLSWTTDCEEGRYDLQWEEYVEVVPGTGIEQPRKLSIRVHGFSKNGRYSGGAWADLKAAGDFVKYTAKT